MKKKTTVVEIVLGLALLSTISASATSYYVSSSTGSDTNSGTSAATAWATLAKVNGSSFAAGDTIYFKRGDTWNEQLIPPSSGVNGNPITFDAYGSGPAPVFTPVVNLSGATWSHNSGNIYTTMLSTTIASPKITNLQLGTMWGRNRAPNPGCTSVGVILGYGDFCVVYPTLYLYSLNGTSPSSYYSSITAIVGQATGLAVISIVGKNWLVFQHIKLQMFDYMGVSVSGSSDNLVFANMEADGMVPNGTAPHGFYVNAASAGNIQYFDDETMFASKSGREKKDAAMSFLENALATVDAIAAREIVDPAKFKEGISKIIDGTVECLNASTWSKNGAQASPASSQM
jgi:hypothetical protein